MKNCYVLDSECLVFLNQISLIEYKKHGLTISQRKMLEEANPHLFDTYTISLPGSDTTANIKQPPSTILSEPGLIVVPDLVPEPLGNLFYPTGIAKIFSQLKTTNDILAFANNYGLLGCRLIEDTNILNSPMKYLNNFSYHHSHFEPLQVWEWHIDHVKRLFQIYRALRYKTQIENELMYVELWPEDRQNDELDVLLGTVYWSDGQLADYSATKKEAAAIDYNKLARSILVSQISQMLQGVINLTYDTIVDDDKSEIGFTFNERHETPFLLAAIYYDMWYTIKNHQVISECEYCHASFTPSKRRKYCNDACKQAAYRKNKEGVTNNG